jgi:hypothetical protein
MGMCVHFSRKLTRFLNRVNYALLCLYTEDIGLLLREKIMDRQQDLNFFVGNWYAKNWQLREHLTGCDDWEEFDGEAVGQVILDGRGNLNEMTLHREEGDLKGLTLRLYDPTSQECAWYWADNLTGNAFVPMQGKLEGDYGEFYAHEIYEGRQVYSRFIWSNITPKSACWERAFSTDGGKTWETNWIMDLRKKM